MDPVAFKIGSLTIHWYGILMATGFVAGMWTAGLRGKKEDLDPEKISSLFFWILLAGIVGAKLLHVIGYWKPSEQSLAAALFSRSGLVFQGALVASTITAGVFMWKNRMPAWKTLDVLAPSISLGYAFGRMGCFFSGCCHGKVCDVASYESLSGGLFSTGEIVSTSGAPFVALKFYEGGLGSIHNLPIYPTQLYEAVCAFALYGALAWWFKNKRFDGQVFLAYLFFASVIRFVIENFRGDRITRFMDDAVTQGQVISLVIIAGVGIYGCFIKAGRQPESA